MSKKLNILQDILRSFFEKDLLFYTRVPNSIKHYHDYKKKISYTKRDRIGVIIQGPIVKNFTIQTVVAYRTIYPNDIFVISTDSKLQKTEIGILKKYKIKLLNYEPLKKNFSNLASQGYGVRIAINYLKKKKIKYVLKTRSDQRFLNPMFLNNIHAWFNFYNYKQKNKILVGNMHARIFWPYDVPDYFVYSNTNELKNFFSYDTTYNSILFKKKYIEKKNNDLKKARTHYDWSRILGGGSYMCINYLKRKYNLKKLKFTLKEYYKHLAKDFIFIDHYSLGLIWNKYNYYINRDHPTMFSKYFSNRDISIIDWIEMLKGKRNFGSGKEQNEKVPWV